jgi:hypothetical protein
MNQKISQCQNCGYEMVLDSRYDPMDRKYCFDCMSRKMQFENGEWD